jgi:magnesium chelatase family protein
MSNKALKEFCILDKGAESLLDIAMHELNLSARSYDRILKVARTIADMNQSDLIAAEHISEAVQYRSLDRELF